MAVAAGVPHIVDEPVDLIPELLDHFFIQQMCRRELIHLPVKALVRFAAAFSLGTRFLDSQKYSPPQYCVDLGDLPVMQGEMRIRLRLRLLQHGGRVG